MVKVNRLFKDYFSGKPMAVFSGQRALVNAATLNNQLHLPESGKPEKSYVLQDLNILKVEL